MYIYIYNNANCRHLAILLSCDEYRGRELEYSHVYQHGIRFRLVEIWRQEQSDSGIITVHGHIEIFLQRHQSLCQHNPYQLVMLPRHDSSMVRVVNGHRKWIGTGTREGVMRHPA